jgi:hypothetical protein
LHGAGAAGHRDEEGDLVAVCEPLTACRVHAADDRQRRSETRRNRGLERAEVFEERLDRRVLWQLDA